MESNKIYNTMLLLHLMVPGARLLYQRTWCRSFLSSIVKYHQKISFSISKSHPEGCYTLRIKLLVNERSFYQRICESRLESRNQISGISRYGELGCDLSKQSALRHLPSNVSCTVFFIACLSDNVYVIVETEYMQVQTHRVG